MTIPFLISMIVFTESPKALTISNTYKQGIYDISEANPFRATAKLINAELLFVGYCYCI